MSNAIFTICSRNYLGQASTLMNSVCIHEPTASRYIVIVDRKVDFVEVDPNIAQTIWLEDLEIEDIEFRALIFDVLELNTNVKPSALRLLLKKHERCVYLDPDTFLYAPLTPVWSGLENSNIVVTPHVIETSSVLNMSMQQDLLRHGGFNLGFIGVSNTAESERFLVWWADRCLNFGFGSPNDGLYVDQKFIDHLHVFFEGVKVLRHPGLNVAYWNLHERPLEWNGERWKLLEEELIFMHFSGFVFCPSSNEEFNQISKYPSVISLSSHPKLRMLFEDYRKSLEVNKYAEYAKFSYSFQNFDNGIPLNRLARRLVAMSDFSVEDRLNPFSSKGQIYKILREAKALNISVKTKSPVRDRKREKVHLSRGGTVLRCLYKCLGVTRYEALLKFFSYAGSTLNQKFLIERR